MHPHVHFSENPWQGCSIESISLTKLDEGVRTGHRGDLLPMLLMKLRLQILQVRKGQLLGEASLTQDEVTHSFLYAVAGRKAPVFICPLCLT